MYTTWEEKDTLIIAVQGPEMSSRSQRSGDTPLPLLILQLALQALRLDTHTHRYRYRPKYSRL